IQRSYDNGTKDYYNQFYKRYENGELRSADSIKIDDSLVYKTPKGKIVYGGGGIIPDVFVPIGSSKVDGWVNTLMESGFMSFYVFEYLDSHRDRYDDYGAKEFEQTVTIDDHMVDDFIYYADDKGLRIDLNPYREDLKLHIKAILAEQLFNENVKQQI